MPIEGVSVQSYDYPINDIRYYKARVRYLEEENAKLRVALDKKYKKDKYI